MPKVIDNYVLDRKIGVGQFGQVFKGYNKTNNQDIAIKVIKREALKGKFSELLDNEIQVLKTCCNPNIIKLYDLKKTPNNFYLVLQYCNEGDLQQYLGKKHRLGEQEAVGFFIQILNAFKTLVANKILHRDFKLANVLKHDGVIKIADFGFSKLLAHEDYTSTMLGSPLNMAPEVLAGNDYNNKADIWSIGVVFYQMLFGHCPYTASNIIDLLSAIKNKPLKFPKNVAISPEVEDVIRKMLVLDCKSRIDWEQLFTHPITNLFPTKEKEQLDDLTINVSKQYIKTNKIIDQPEPKRNIVKKESTTRSAEQKSEGTTTDSNSETEREKHIKIFKRNANKLLHHRNVYVFLASVAEQTMNNLSYKLSEIIGYLLVKKVLSLIEGLKASIESEVEDMELWNQFTKQPDFADIKQYVTKEHTVFAQFYHSIRCKILKSKSKLSTAIQNLFQQDHSESTLQQYLKEYVSVYIKDLSPLEKKKKDWIHVDRLLDCLNLNQAFPFQTNGNIFNFKNYYQSSEKLTVVELQAKVSSKWLMLQ